MNVDVAYIIDRYEASGISASHRKISQVDIGPRDQQKVVRRQNRLKANNCPGATNASYQHITRNRPRFARCNGYATEKKSHWHIDIGERIAQACLGAGCRGFVNDSAIGQGPHRGVHDLAEITVRYAIDGEEQRDEEKT
jgi:hypothetical protein